jgi:hypothetical protein
LGELKWLGELAYIYVNLPPSYGENFGSGQWGWHSDWIYPVFKGMLFQWRNVRINTSLRLEFVDYNLDTFNETGSGISDHVFSVMPGVSFRFSENTVLRVNYRYRWDTDFLGNPAQRTAGFQFGFASYF